jgi:hypothetical protein
MPGKNGIPKHLELLAAQTAVLDLDGFEGAVLGDSLAKYFEQFISKCIFLYGNRLDDAKLVHEL